MKKCIFSHIIVLFFIIPVNAYSQCRITHLSGSENYNGIIVAISEKGSVDSFINYLNYCNGKIGPYGIGVHPNPFSCKTGSYTFTFSPPVSELYLNFGSINGDAYGELIRIYLNDTHYPLTNVGEALGCQQMAVLTPDGNIASPNWDVAGWEGTKITGTIQSLTVQDSIDLNNLNCGNGSIFSLSFCQWPLSSSGVEKEANILSVYPNPASTILQIKNAPLKSIKQLYNAIGQLIHTPSPLERGSITEIDVSHVPKGIYYLKVGEVCKKVVVE